MANPYPYFQWYVTDAETDEFYVSLTFEEKGFYHHCLNRSWINWGLPADSDELARALGVTAKYLDKMWARMSQKFTLTETVRPRYVNARQEVERQKAIEKSAKNKRPGNTNATRGKRERDLSAIDSRPESNASGAQHARAGADSDSDSESKKQETPSRKVSQMPPREPAPAIPDLDKRYRAVYDRHIVPGFMQDGEYLYAKIIGEAVNPARTADLIDESQIEWMAFFRDNPDVWRPGIGRWLSDGYFTRKASDSRARDSPKQTASQIAIQRAREEDARNAQSRESR